MESYLGKPPASVSINSSQENDKENVSKIINQYGNHPSITKIKQHLPIPTQRFTIPMATKGHINKILKNLNTKKATGPDGIPPKLVKLVADTLDEPITFIINNDLKRCMFSENAKTGNVTPLYKNKD